MQNRRIPIIFLVLTLAMFLVNWYARKRLPLSYSVQLSYNELYLDRESLRIETASSDQNALVIKLGGATGKIQTNVPRTNFVDSSTIKFDKNAAENHFWMKQPGAVDSLHFSISYTGTEVYKNAGNSSEGQFEINSSSLVFSDADLTDHRQWSFDFGSAPNAELQTKQLRNYLRDSIGILEKDPGLIRLEKIFAHLKPIVQPNKGLPADSVHGKAPLELIFLLKQQRIKLWCGDISSLLGAITTAAGLPTRLVTTEGYRSFAYPVHSFNEVFLQEYQCWVFTDLTSGVAYIKPANRPLNTIQLNRALRSGIPQKVILASVMPESVGTITVDSLPAIFISYFAAPQRFRFYYPEYLTEQRDHPLQLRLGRLINPAYSYAYYSEDNHFSSPDFLARSLSGYMLILILIADCVIITRLMLRKKQHV